MVFFHPHKSRFQVCFGIAVPVLSHDLIALFVSQQAFPAFFQFLIQFLYPRLLFSSAVNKEDPLPFCDPQQVPPEPCHLKRGAVVDLNDRIIGRLLIFCQLQFPVFFDDAPDLFHTLYDKHFCVPKVYFWPYSLSCRRVLYFA